MAKLIYAVIASLDGYVADEQGDFDWAAPDEEVHTFVNDLERRIGTHLYGRRMYETMVYWETAHTLPDEPPVILDYARVWQAADKVVYSRTLDHASSKRTRIERNFDPDEVARMKKVSDRDISVGGPHLAAEALKAGLVDELQLIIAPAIVGSGNPALPDGWRAGLTLVDERRFNSGFVYLGYRF